MLKISNFNNFRNEFFDELFRVFSDELYFQISKRNKNLDDLFNSVLVYEIILNLSFLLDYASAPETTKGLGSRSKDKLKRDEALSSLKELPMPKAYPKIRNDSFVKHAKFYSMLNYFDKSVVGKKDGEYGYNRLDLKLTELNRSIDELNSTIHSLVEKFNDNLTALKNDLHRLNKFENISHYLIFRSIFFLKENIPEAILSDLVHKSFSSFPDKDFPKMNFILVSLHKKFKSCEFEVHDNSDVFSAIKTHESNGNSIETFDFGKYSPPKCKNCGTALYIEKHHYGEYEYSQPPDFCYVYTKS